MQTESWTPRRSIEALVAQSTGYRVSDSSPVTAAELGKKRKATSTLAGERKKATRACDSCKEKKARCSGTRPCTRCIRSSLLCDYNAAYSRGIPPDPLPAPTESTSPHESILLQRSISTATAPHSAPESSGFQPPIEQNAEPDLAATRIPNGSSRDSPEPGAIDFEGNYIGPSSGISFFSRAWRRLHEDSGLSVPTDLQTEASQDMSVFSFGDRPFSTSPDPDIVLPSREASEQLISMFFDFAVVTYRILHRGTLEKWLRDLYELDPPLNIQVSKSEAGRAAVVFIVFAVATLHQEHGFPPAGGIIKHASCSEHWLRAAEHMLSIETGPPKVETIQAKYVQCLYLLAANRANQCWYTFGTTIQLLTAVGLHRKRAREKPGEDGAYIQDEVRKRLFWAAYTLDKYLSVMLGRPKHLQDEDIDQDLPEEVNDEDMSPNGPIQKRGFSDCVISGFVYHVKLSRIVGEISREVYAVHPVSEDSRLEAAHRLTRDLEAWKASLPPLFSSIRPSSLVPPFSRQSNVLRLAYAHAMIHANRSFLLSSFSPQSRRTQVAKQGTFKIHVQKCIEAAEEVIRIVDSISSSDEWPLFQAFWFTHYASFCAVLAIYVFMIQRHRLENVEVAVSNASDVRLGMKDRNLLDLAERCQRHLAEATRDNCPSRRYSIILEELRLDVHQEIDKPRAQLVSTEESIPDSRDDASKAVQQELCHVPANSIPPEAHVTRGLLDARDIGANPDSQVAHNSMDPVMDVSYQADSSYNNWTFMDWTQLDSWAFSNTLDDQLAPKDWLLQ